MSVKQYHSDCFFFFFNDTATAEIYSLSLHDALPISGRRTSRRSIRSTITGGNAPTPAGKAWRSEEHTSELQSRLHLVCRLLLEKKKKEDFFKKLNDSIISTHKSSGIVMLKPITKIND